MGNEAVRREEYRALGTVTEFTYSTQVRMACYNDFNLKINVVLKLTQIGMVFQQIDRNLAALEKWGVESGFLPSKYSFVFVCNHDK